MSCYENLVMKTQMNYSRHYSTYASGGTAVVLSKQKPLSYEEQIQEFVRIRKVKPGLAPSGLMCNGIHPDRRICKDIRVI